MPNVVVYVPAAVWRLLNEQGDAAVAVREFARQGWEALRDGSDSGAARHRDPGPAESLAGVAPEHFKPDPK